MRNIIAIAALFLMVSCQKKETIPTPKTELVKDVHSFSNPNEAVAKHLDLAIKVDFDTQTISGKASWTIENTTKGNQIIRDEIP